MRLTGVKPFRLEPEECGVAFNPETVRPATRALPRVPTSPWRLPLTPAASAQDPELMEIKNMHR